MAFAYLERKNFYKMRNFMYNYAPESRKLYGLSLVTNFRSGADNAIRKEV